MVLDDKQWIRLSSKPDTQMQLVGRWSEKGVAEMLYISCNTLFRHRYWSDSVAGKGEVWFQFTGVEDASLEGR